MIDDLGMTGVQYNTVLSIFFIPYVLFEVPSNVLLKKFKRPSTYLGILVLSWGIIMTCTGLVNNYGSLMVVRVLLGIFEAGFFPGAIYLCSYWYMPKDLALRISYFYCASALSGAFSGLLAAAIAEMDGVGGYEGWRWIFILEGLATVVLGVACFFLLIDTPALSTRWLEPDEIQYLELSMFIKQGGRTEHDTGFKWRDLMMVLTNWRVYMQAWFLFAQSALSYGTPPFTLQILFTAVLITSRNKVHSPDNHQVHGLQRHKRPADICTALRRGRNLRHRLRPPLRPLLLANAVRRRPHVNRHSGVLDHHLAKGRAPSQHGRSIFRRRPGRHRYLPDSSGRRVLEREQHCPCGAESNWDCADELCW